ncbi:MAG: MATE family efflux transporter [Firmicutes bacterium]|jgi:putative MATE family efflux protein|nr:MATE family efflux transporter [Bacillota bacterium]
MRIQLSDHFTYRRLLRFVISPILMMVCTSMYSIVDGIFVSNFVGKTPFASVNLIMPIMMGVACIGFMFGTGGSAIVAKTLGEGKPEQANRYFSMLIMATAVLGLCFSCLGFLLIRRVSMVLGAEGELLENCVIYGRILFAAEPFFILQNTFQNFFATAEKPGMSLKVSLAAGLTNFALDFLFIVVFHWGIAGAALATALGQVVGAVLPLIYFSRKNTSLLKLGKTRFYGWVLRKTCTNGSSEMVTNLAMSIVNILYNFQLMRLAGENGVAAYGIIMYVNFVFTSVFLGYAIGSAPITSYNYGAANYLELRNMRRKSLALMGGGGVVMVFLAQTFAVPLVMIFASYDAELFAMTCHGFRLYSIAFMMMGISIWASSFFTALENGLISAAIAFLRTIVFECGCILVLPYFLGLNGVWLSIVVAESMSVILSGTFLAAKKGKYHY